MHFFKQTAMDRRIVYVAPRLPYPPHNGWTQRNFQVLRTLASIGNVHLICYASGQDPQTIDQKPLQQLCESVNILEPPPARWSEPIRTYRDLLERFVCSWPSFLVADFPGHILAERVASLADSADFIWTVRLFTAEWIPIARDRMIVDLDDIESIKERRRLALQPFWPGKLPLYFDVLKLRFLERTAPARYARVVICSEKDRQHFPGRLARRVLVVPNGVSTHLLNQSRGDDEDKAPTIVFVGNMEYAPNLDAALWFTREIFPQIAAAVPGIRLYLVGYDGQQHLRPLDDGKNIIVTGRVEDVTRYVSRATVSVVPLRWGGGTRIKILESLALGTPVVSTTIGAEGLDVQPGRHILLADTPEDFATAVVNLLRDRGTREAMAAAGRALVAEKYTWERIGGTLKAYLEKWLATRTQGPRYEASIPVSTRASGEYTA